MPTNDRTRQFLSLSIAIITIVGFAGIGAIPAAADDPSPTADDDVELQIHEGEDADLICIDASLIDPICVNEDDSPLVGAAVQEVNFATGYALGASDNVTTAFGEELEQLCITIMGDETCGDDIVPHITCGSFGVVDVSESCNDTTDSTVNNL